MAAGCWLLAAGCWLMAAEDKAKNDTRSQNTLEYGFLSHDIDDWVFVFASMEYEINDVDSTIDTHNVVKDSIRDDWKSL